MFVRATAISILALLSVVQTSGQASADHGSRLKVLWPKIYAPRISGQLYRNRFDEAEDEGFFDWEDEEEFIPRRRKNRNIVLEFDEDDFEPVYEPPRKKKIVKAKPKAKVAKKAPAKSTKTVAKISKPATKPLVKSAAVAPTVTKATVAKVPSGTAVATVKPFPQTSVQKTTASPPAPSKVQLAAVAPTQQAAPAQGTIGCSKGAEIVSGYGFTSVKPRSCSGGTYSFAATRAASAYVIKVAAATGEITDVQKLK